jgi:hypothetical protein
MTKLKNAVLILCLLLGIPSICFCQSEQNATKKFGVGYNFSYNQKTMHHKLPLFWKPNNHLFYIGIQQTSILQSLGDPIDVYEKENFGFNAGWQYVFITIKEHVGLFFQYDFTFYQTTFKSFQLGPPGVSKITTNGLENSLTFGGNLRFGKRFIVSPHLGFGSRNGFFLLLDEAFFSANIGLLVMVF